MLMKLMQFFFTASSFVDLFLKCVDFMCEQFGSSRYWMIPLNNFDYITILYTCYS